MKGLTMTPRIKDISMTDQTTVVMKDSSLVFPEIYMSIYVEGDSYEQRAFAEMFVKARCNKANSPETADLVIFTGGPDVDPALYGETKHSSVSVSKVRDDIDLKLYKLCYDQGIPMLGICRGAQFLHVMNGGKLFQHVDKHYGDHVMWDCRAQTVINRVSSVHHQMCMPNRAGGMEVLADARISTERWRNADTVQKGKEQDIEAFFYRDTCSLGIQGHPEYRGYSQFQKWSFEQIREFVCHNPDIEAINNHYRLKPALVKERNDRKNKVLEAMN